MTLTPAQQKAREAYLMACERLAAAAVYKVKAIAEMTAAMTQFHEARGAAVSTGVLSE